MLGLMRELHTMVAPAETRSDRGERICRRTSLKVFRSSSRVAGRSSSSYEDGMVLCDQIRGGW